MDTQTSSTYSNAILPSGILFIFFCVLSVFNAYIRGASGLGLGKKARTRNSLIYSSFNSAHLQLELANSFNKRAEFELAPTRSFITRVT